EGKEADSHGQGFAEAGQHSSLAGRQEQDVQQDGGDKIGLGGEAGSQPEVDGAGCQEHKYKVGLRQGVQEDTACEQDGVPVGGRCEIVGGKKGGEAPEQKVQAPKIQGVKRQQA